MCSGRAVACDWSKTNSQCARDRVCAPAQLIVRTAQIASAVGQFETQALANGLVVGATTSLASSAGLFGTHNTTVWARADDDVIELIARERRLVEWQTTSLTAASLTRACAHDVYVALHCVRSQ
jgi:hypothetical protein